MKDKELTWTTKRVRLGDLIEYDKNPVQISERDAKELAKSLKKYNNVIPYVAAAPPNGTKAIPLLDGHQRKLVSMQMNNVPASTMVDVRIPSRKLTEKEKQELIIRLRKNTGEFDFDKLANYFEVPDLLEWGFSEKELQLGGFEFEDTTQDAEPQIDRAAELLEKWQVKTGDLWQIGEHRLICGDCTDAAVVARVMGGERADCVFTSPPYAVGVDYGETYQDTIDNLRDMLPKLSRMWLNVVVDGGFAVLNFGDIVSASKIAGTDEPCEYPMALEYFPVFRADGWLLWTRRIWCKPGAGTGSMQCISSNRAATNWEHLWTFKKPGGKPMFSKQTTGDYPSQNGWIDSTHEEGLAVGLKVHGAGMPPLPALFSISNHSTAGGVVLEPFSGTGTTMVCSERLGRKCYATEISPSFVAIALERMSQAFPHLEIKRIEPAPTKSKKKK